AAAATLAARGCRVTVFKNRLDPREPGVERLRAAGCRLKELAKLPLLPRMIYSAIAIFTYPLTFGYQAVRFYLSLRLRRRPDLLVISQGGNHDGWLYAQVAIRLRLPFVLISQKATDLYWPLDTRRGWIREAYEGARWSFFVSRHNLALTQEQLGIRLEHASVARNPFNVTWEASREWPRTDLGFRFACIGRLYPKEKGQDLVLRVLARPKWRARPVSLTFFGSGEQAAGLAGMADFLGLENVRFGGFVQDVDAVWADHHALVLPSRAEGLPLVLVEAMLCGRVAIVTDVAGNPEVVEDGVTGFLARAATEDALDEAMERAWQRRGEWREIGALAAERIRRLVPRDPAAVMADHLLGLCDSAPPAIEAGPGVGADQTTEAAPREEGRLRDRSLAGAS
ncbi:MAG TPA: glycosyltransferase, partial [Allosphingosinicella sp.]|nr:glycosyltransferase [Allosphingosinicella sp.]